ncbi:DUF1015 family protein, partial [Candidatus Woesearchaeota archaeon]|nr:DUF1015 family protein [Candidatus Woesearchaeota archaeon]
DVEFFYRLSPYNIVRIINGKKMPDDDQQDNRYSRARAVFERWLAEKVLERSERPAMYVYEQVFTVDGRKRSQRGIVAAMRLEPFGQGHVLPHEKTFPKASEDRYRLIKATRANFGQIFTIYPDQDRKIARILEKAVQAGELAGFDDKDGVTHRIYRIDDAADTAALAGLMKEKTVYIADGHHRYSQAVRYMQEMNSKHPDSPPDALFNFRMVTFVNMDDVTILPVHRLISGIDQDVEDIKHRLEEHFELVEHGVSDVDAMVEEMHEQKHAFGLYCKRSNKCYTIRLKDEGLIREIDGSHCNAWKRLDVNIIHQLFVERILDIKEDIQDHIIFSKDHVREIVSPGYSKDFQIAVFMNPVSVSELRDIANEHERMPQKSTYFYPKLFSGLVMSPLE